MSDQYILEELNEEEKIEKAKRAGLCIIGLISSLVWLLWILWTEWGFIMHLFTLCSFVFLSYKSVMLNAFPIAYQTTQKYFKFSKVHAFSECMQPKHKTEIRRQFNQKKDPESDELKNNTNTSAGNHIERQERRTLKIYMGRQKSAKQVHKKKQRASRSLKKEDEEQQYLSIREAAKKTTNFLKEKGMKLQLFEHLPYLIKNDYSNKVEQLLLIHQQNQQAITAVLEQHYQIKIMFASVQTIPEKLESVHFDDAIERLKLLGFTRSLPWTERRVQQQQKHKLYENLTELINRRNSIDQFLKPGKKLSHKAREQIISSIKEQLKGERPFDRTLLVLLMHFFNENVKIDDYKLQLQKINPIRRGSVVVEAHIGNRYHLNLSLVRGEKIKELVIRPGDDNMWTLLAVAAEVYKLRVDLSDCKSD